MAEENTSLLDLKKPEALVGQLEKQAGISGTPALDEAITYTPETYEVKPEEMLTAPQPLGQVGVTPTTVPTEGLAVQLPGALPATTYTAQTVADKLPEEMQSALQDQPTYAIGDIQGQVSPDALAKAAQGEVSKESLVSYQLGELYKSIEDGKPLPAWAAGASRGATAVMQQRGLGASSMAAAAVTQAILESGLPIAKSDADRYGQMDLANLNARQQTTLQNAATVAAMDRANLDARLQAAVTNAQTFLSIDLKNLDNAQKTNTVNYQAELESLYKDQAYENAARQFNAESQTQMDQFFTALGAEVEAANKNRVAAMEQFNANQTDAMAQYVTSMNDAREKFNIDMQLQIDQSNTVWRRNINTANTALQNEANMMNTQNLLGLTQSAQNALWQQYRDEVAWAIQMAENQLQRNHQIGLLGMEIEANKGIYEMQSNDQMTQALGGAVLNGVFSVLKG